MPDRFSTKTYLALALGILFAGLSVVTVVAVNGTMRQLALNDARDAARMLLDHNLAVHTYFSKDLKPKLFEKLGPITSKDYFEPVWMSSTYAIREMDKYFRHFNPNAYYYKECAVNARSPENEADNYEKSFLQDLENSPDLTAKSAIRVFDGKPYFTLLRRGESMEESCLRCHSTPDKAPGDLVRQYGPERSFNKKEKEVAQAISIRIPLSEAFSTANRFSYSLIGLLLAVLGGGFFFVWIGNRRLFIDPVSRIREHAVRIATEPKRLGLTIPEPKVKELHDLVGAFNKMSLALKRSYDDLEQRVLDRTRELAMERERLAVTLRSIGDGVIGTDTEGRVTALNRQAEHLTGWKEEEALGRPLEEVFVIVGEDTGEPCENPAAKVLASGEVVGLANKTVLIAKDGTERILADSGAPIRGKDGKVLGVVLVFRDATERVRAEEELKKREALLKEAQGVAHVGHWELEGPSGTPIWSEEIFHIFGLDPARGEPSFAAHRDIIHAEDWGLVHDAVNSLSERGEPFDIEFRLFGPDGTIRWMNAKGYPTRNEQGEIVRLFGTAQDFTDRKQAELDLKNQITFMESLLEAIPAPVFFKDTRHVYLGCNAAFAEFIGRGKEEIVGKSVFEVAPKELAEAYRAQDQELFNNPGSQVYEIMVESSDGSKRDVIFHKAVFRDASGAVAGLIGAILDITERKKTEEERATLRRQLARAQRMEAIGTLTGGIAHDFNNLLTIINGYTELMLLEKTEDDPSYADLQKVFETGRKGADLVQRLLALSRKSESHPQPLDLNEIVGQSVALMERTFPKMIEIDASLDKDLGIVDADASQIEQVLMNLCVNAKDAMPNGGGLHIRTENIVVDEEHRRAHPEAKTGPHVLMEISDTGAGMNNGTLERVFEPFFTTKGWDFNKGTGLGLSVAKGIVEQHGGWITCESEPGKGTTFRVYLPAIHESPSVNARKPEGLLPAVKKILLVDDEEYVRDLGRRILEQGGHTVITASGGKEALEIYAEERENIGLVILDLLMPHMGGGKCLEALLKIDPNVKVIVSTGHSPDAAESRRLGMLAKGFVHKPYKVEELIRAVGEIV
ncbi:MAG: PAS domain S-box protein [Pseudomonadota bacterium]